MNYVLHNWEYAHTIKLEWVSETWLLARTLWWFYLRAIQPLIRGYQGW